MSKTPRYLFKRHPHSSHTIILGWLGPGRSRRLLNIVASDGWLRRRPTEQGWRMTAIEQDMARARAKAAPGRRE